MKTTIFFFFFLLACYYGAYPNDDLRTKTVHLINNNQQLETIQIEMNLFDGIMFVKHTNSNNEILDSCHFDFWYDFPEITIQQKKFLILRYQERCGSNCSSSGMAILSLNKMNKLIPSLEIHSYYRYFMQRYDEKNQLEFSDHSIDSISTVSIDLNNQLKIVEHIYHKNDSTNIDEKKIHYLNFTIKNIYFIKT